MTQTVKPHAEHMALFFFKKKVVLSFILHIRGLVIFWITMKSEMFILLHDKYVSVGNLKL